MRIGELSSTARRSNSPAQAINQRFPNALCFPAGVRPAAELLSFASPKESIQRKGDPKVTPYAALRVTLRFLRKGESQF
jgi:hypothetical protein